MTRDTRNEAVNIEVPEVVSFRPNDASKRVLKRAKAKGLSYSYAIQAALTKKGAR